MQPQQRLNVPYNPYFQPPTTTPTPTTTTSTTSSTLNRLPTGFPSQQPPANAPPGMSPNPATSSQGSNNLNDFPALGASSNRLLERGESASSLSFSSVAGLGAASSSASSSSSTAAAAAAAQGGRLAAEREFTMDDFPALSVAVGGAGQQQQGQGQQGGGGGGQQQGSGPGTPGRMSREDLLGGMGMMGGGFGGAGANGLLQSQFGGQGAMLGGGGGFSRLGALAAAQGQTGQQQAQSQQSVVAQQQQDLLGLVGGGMKRPGAMPGLNSSNTLGASMMGVAGGPLNFTNNVKSGQPSLQMGGGPSPMGFGQNAIGSAGSSQATLIQQQQQQHQPHAGVVGAPGMGTGNSAVGGSAAGTGGGGGLSGNLIGGSAANPGANATSTPAAMAAALSGIQQEDKFGLLGLIDVIRMTDPDMNMLALGCDLAGLGLNLNSAEPLYSTFMSVFSSAPTDSNEPIFHSPPCYTLPKPNQPPPAVSKMSSLTDESLFYAFYAMPREQVAEAAAQELYQRSWRYHKEMKLWLCRDTEEMNGVAFGDKSNGAASNNSNNNNSNNSNNANSNSKTNTSSTATTTSTNANAATSNTTNALAPSSSSSSSAAAAAAAVNPNTSAPNYVKGNGFERGVFIFFDPANWMKVKKEWVVYYEMLEERRNVSLADSDKAAGLGVSGGGLASSSGGNGGEAAGKGKQVESEAAR
ncbi:hypothetical protein HDV05_004200 [Chytridiales sp. JEL 0842]|nr:hypothetical protein HDV05_004200 [Chytridiales sp. JEL 0842]